MAERRALASNGRGRLNVKTKLQDDLKTAMKAGDKLRVMTLRGVLTEVTRIEKAARPAAAAESAESGPREISADEITQVLKRERARRDEALEFARKGNRQDLIEQNEAEARILDEYLPKAVGADEVKAAIAEQMAAGVVQIGPLMKALRERFGANLDGKMASELVKQSLAK
jgi:uncharacterized protein